MSNVLNGKRIGITGVSGFIGRHLAERCLVLGAHVKGLDLHSAPHPEIDFIEGDITSPVDATALAEDCDIVIHTAAIVREGGLQSLFQKVNVGGTATIVQAAREAGVRRFLQVSSVMVYGFEIQGELLETAPLRGAGNPYCQTKIDSEVLALQNHRPGEFDVTVIRCGDVYGPGSIPWTIRPVKMMQAGVFTLADGGAGILNHVYVDNLVDGILLAMVSDVSGEAFNLTDGEAATCRDFFMHYARMLGRTKLRSAPAFLLRSGLQLNHGFLSVFGLEPRIHPDSIAYVTRRGTYSITKARKLLGYEPRVDLATGMHSTEAWLKHEGLIPTHRSSAS